MREGFSAVIVGFSVRRRPKYSLSQGIVITKHELDLPLLLPDFPPLEPLLSPIPAAAMAAVVICAGGATATRIGSRGLVDTVTVLVDVLVTQAVYVDASVAAASWSLW